MLQIQSLHKKYNQVVAVDHVSFNAYDGEVTVILGPNGAGKSTIIKSVAGLLRYEGEIFINGKKASEIEAKKEFSYVPEIPAMYPLLTVREHLIFTSKAYGITDNDDEIDALMQRFELQDKQEKYGDELSKGMMQKVSICSALLTHPNVIVLDEPMVGLDPKAIKELKRVMKELKESGVTVIISTHMIEMVEDVWDKVIVMETGKIRAEIAKNDYPDEDLETLFFKITGETYE
ncbi:MAG: ABC transporter ATP-binding protein [Erysipelothrix sp.]